MTTPLLNADDLHFSYGSKDVLRGIDLEIHEGELVGLIGPNGVGKSTLLKIVAGLLKPSKGYLYVNGRDLHLLHPKQRAKEVAVVPQDPRVPQGFTALETVLMGRNPHLGLLQMESRHDVALSYGALARTGSIESAHHLVSDLSGGEAQRVFIARAINQEASLLLLDEPLANLDIVHQTEIMDIVSDIQKERGSAVLMAIHDLTLASQYCTRMVLLHEGRVLACGVSHEVLTMENVVAAYGGEVSLMAHPINGAPVVLPKSHRVRQGT